MPNRAAARPTRDRPRRAVTLAALARLIAYSVSTKQKGLYARAPPFGGAQGTIVLGPIVTLLAKRRDPREPRRRGLCASENCPIGDAR